MTPWLKVLLGAPLLAFGLVILLGAAVRLGGGTMTMPVFTFLAVTVIAGLLPVGIGSLLIYQGLRRKNDRAQKPSQGGT